MAFIAENGRNKLWFGTQERAGWFPTPNRGADMSASGWSAGGDLLNGGGYQLNSFGSHKSYIFEWPASSAPEVAQKMKSYADGTYGRGLIYFLDPITWTRNVLPAAWADPSMGIGYEGSSLVYGVDPTSVPTSGWEANDLPVNSAYYDLGGVATGWRGKEEAVFIPVPTGYTLSLGSFHSQSGTGRVYYREQATNGALGAIVDLVPLANSSGAVVNTFVSGASLAGVWLYVGKIGAGAGSVTLTGMVGRLIPTVNAVSTLVARNHAPSLYGPTAPVEVRRNYVPNSDSVAASPAGWNVLSGASFTFGVDAGEGVVNVTTPGVAVNEGVYSDNATSWIPAAGDLFNGSVMVKAPAGATLHVVLSSQGAGLANRTVPFTGTGAWQKITSPTAAVAGAARNPYMVIRTTPTAQAISFQIKQPLIEKVTASTGQGSQVGEFFSHTRSPDADMTAGSTGGVNVSPAILTGLHPTGFTDSNCVSIIHEVGDGTRELRQIPTTASNSSYTYYSIPATGTLRADGTSMATLRLPAPQTGTTNTYSRSLRIEGPTQYSPQSPNVAGTYQHRPHYTNLTSGYRTYIYAGGVAGSGDVYWSNIGLMDGDYQDEWFDGNSGNIVIGGQNVRTQWDGVPGQSTSSAWTVTPAFDALKRGPWIGGMGHSGCRFAGKPTYVGNTGVGGGQVSFAATFVEVGSWING